MSKIVRKNIRTGEKRNTGSNQTVRQYYIYYLPALIFILSGLYFYLYGNYVFYYQENLSLFVFSGDYLSQFLSKPGGLLEYAGNFLIQGYFNNLYGALILSTVFTAITFIFLKINKKLSSDNPFSPVFAVMASCLLILMQTNNNYLMHNNLGFLLAGLYFLFSISSGKKLHRILFLVLFPLFFYIAGAYAWVYLGMFTVYSLLRRELISPVLLLLIAGLSLLLFKRVIFLQPWSELLYFPMPLKGFFSNPYILWLFFIFFVLYPALIGLAGLIKIKNAYRGTFTIFSVLAALFLTVFQMSKIYSQDVADLFRLEKMFLTGDWNGVIRQQENSQSKSPVAQYYYNIALSEKGLLCERLFLTPQDYGAGAISIPWNSQIPINKLFRGVYFYYSIGLINEAHRWAFESMVIQGYRPENIKLLIKTDLINGNYKVAEKYINVLKKTLHYRDLAKKFEAMLINPELIKSDPELGEKIKLKPQDDFIVRIRNPQTNITSLLRSNPGNKKAFEYEMAWLMLDKNVDGIIDNLDRLAKMNYSKIPRHIEEAVLFIRANIGLNPELNKLKLSEETEFRFAGYLASMMKTERTKSPESSVIPKELRNTFWYYLDFKHPQ